MRALSSLDHRRRRSAPVISSIRRTSVTPPRPSALLSSLRSSLMSKSSLMGRHYATTRTLPKRGKATPLTIQRHTHPKRDQDDNGHNELGEDAIAHFAFAFSPNATRRRIACALVSVLSLEAAIQAS